MPPPRDMLLTPTATSDTDTDTAVDGEKMMMASLRGSMHPCPGLMLKALQRRLGPTKSTQFSQVSKEWMKKLMGRNSGYLRVQGIKCGEILSSISHFNISLKFCCMNVCHHI